jgi:hypothetical protein
MSTLHNERRLTCGFIVVLTLIGLHVGAPLARAQQDATILGQVTDETGAALPGVAVTATSPALQVGTVTTVTDTRGEYRLAPLPIGIYVVDYALSGFSSVRREGLRLTVGFTATVDVALKVGALAESITVSAASPVVDITSGTTATTFTRETLEVAPTSRNGLVGLMAQAPGVRTNPDVGGSTITEVPASRLFGQSGEPWATLEGVPTTAIVDGGGNGNYWDYVTVEEAAVKTIGNDAEHPNRGVSITAVVRSGGNQFHGGGYYGRMFPKLQSNNITPELAAQGITEPPSLVRRYDTNADLGGRIVPNKLWFYVATRRRIDISQGTNSFKEDGTPATNDELSWFATQKVNWQMSANHRLVGFYQYNHKDTQPSGNQFVSYRSTTAYGTLSRTGKLEWQGIKGNSIVLDAQVGTWGYDSVYVNNAGDDVSRLDLGTTVQTGPSTSAGQRPKVYRHDMRASVGWYKPHLFYGDHQFKVGTAFDLNSFGRAYPGNEDTPKFNYQLVTRNGTPVELRTWNQPTIPEARTNYFEAYVKDEWRVSSRLTFNVGVRFAHDNGYVPASSRVTATPPADLAYPAQEFPRVQFNVWKTLAPRAHVTYDLTGNGKTVLKGGWGRFAKMRMLNPEVAAVDPNVYGYASYRWTDPNGNGLYDAGEINLDPNGPAFLTQQTNNFIVNPNEKMPWSEEWSLSLEREIRPSLALRATGVYSSNSNVYRNENIFRPYSAYSIAVPNVDPGPDGVAGNGDDPGRTLTYYEYPTALQGQRFDKNWLTNDDDVDQSFRSMEFGLFKRMSQGWQLMASFSATKKNIPLTVGLTQSQVNSNIYAGDLNPNSEINTRDTNWERTGKVSAAYSRIPFGITAAVNYEFRNGTPLARTVVLRGGTTIPNLVVNADPIGSLWTPNYHLTDIRVEKSVSLGSGRRVSIRANIFNALNNSTVLALQTRAGATFGNATSIIQPRIMELNVAYAF